jgi:hypothetical protein
MAGTLVVDTLQTGTGTNISTASIAKGIAQAWVNFTYTGSAVSIKSSFNVSSVTRSNTGAYLINFTSGTFTDANYTFTFGVASGHAYSLISQATPTSNQFQIQLFVTTSGGVAELDAGGYNSICLAFYR